MVSVSMRVLVRLAIIVMVVATAASRAWRRLLMAMLICTQQGSQGVRTVMISQAFKSLSHAAITPMPMVLAAAPISVLVVSMAVIGHD